MKRPSPDSDMVAGFWIGSNYGITGHRWDYAFDLLSDGSYFRRIRRQEEEWKIEEGRWRYDEGTLHFDSKGEPIAPQAYSTYFIPRFEDFRSILVIRPLIFATPNPPMILYRDFLKTLEARQRNSEGQGVDQTDWGDEFVQKCIDDDETEPD
jgi:hypothetical protein